MKANPKLLIVGVDAADRQLIEQWALEGALPAFSRLMKQSVWGDSKNPTGMVSGTVWPTFYTGVMPGRTGRFRGTTQFRSGTYQHADIDLERYAHPTFWDVLGEAGRTCLVIDAPYAFLSNNPHVTQLVDWCSHSPWKDGVTISRPDGLAGEIRTEYGRDPIGKCDFVTLDVLDDVRRFRDALIERIGMRTELTKHQLRREDFDVFLHVFSECHCAGHQLWHLHDPSHPIHDRSMVELLGGDPLKAVYVAIDSAIGTILEEVGASTHVMMFLSHGIGPAYTGTHLLDEVLLRLEGVPSPRRRQRVAQHMVATWTRFPRSVRALLTPLQKTLWPRLKANLVQPGKSKRRYFEIIVNDAAGGIRLNVRGREPEGVVEPGAEYEAVCALLEQTLLELVDPATGKRVIDRVLRPQQLYPGPHAARLPDLEVLWSRDAPFSAAKSDRIGTVTHRFVFANHRTGDHTENDGLFFFAGPHVEPRHVLPVGVQDLGPTIASMFGATMADADGKPIPALLEHLARQQPTAVAEA